MTLHRPPSLYTALQRDISVLEFSDHKAFISLGIDASVQTLGVPDECRRVEIPV